MLNKRNLLILLFSVLQFSLSGQESAYQKCLEEELYWKQNMPYYKSEK